MKNLKDLLNSKIGSPVFPGKDKIGYDLFSVLGFDNVGVSLYTLESVEDDYIQIMCHDKHLINQKIIVPINTIRQVVFTKGVLVKTKNMYI